MRASPGYGKVNRKWGDTWPFWRWMPLFILPMGITMLWRRNGAQSPASAWPNSEHLTMENQTGGIGLSLHRDPKARRAFWIAFGIAFAMAFTANALTASGLRPAFRRRVKGTFFGLLAGHRPIFAKQTPSIESRPENIISLI